MMLFTNSMEKRYWERGKSLALRFFFGIKWHITGFLWSMPEEQGVIDPVTGTEEVIGEGTRELHGWISMDLPPGLTIGSS